MAATGFTLREIEIQVDLPNFVCTGEPMTVFGLNTGVRILDNVPATAEAANSANPSGLLYGGIAVQSSGTDGNVNVCAYVYSNSERTEFVPIALRKPEVLVPLTTLTLACAANSKVKAMFNTVPVVAPYGVRVSMSPDTATEGTVSVDLFLMEAGYGSSLR
jgi:hypothetical protein